MIPLLIEDLTFSFPGLAVPVLAVDRLSIAAGERVAITGPSGSGKSTFVNIVTGLQRSNRGRVSWSDTDIADLSEGRRDRWRARHVGLVMQDFHLLPGLSAIENILLPARLAWAAGPDIIGRARDLMATTGLIRPQQKIETMSRGEMQRVAICRALLRKPGIVVADEPTASLDGASGDAVGSLLLDMAKVEGSTLIVVSHDPRLIDRLPRRLTFHLGRIVADTGGSEEKA